MRGKRSKQYRKLMAQYEMTFGFRGPYQVLIDAQMIQDTEKFKMDLIGGLERTLGSKVKSMITQCSMRHLYLLKEVSQPTKDALILTAKSMERRRCNHHVLDEPLSTLECFSSVIDPKKSHTNKNRYVVASQDEDVRRYCREIKGVPLVFVKRSVMVMEPMAPGSINAREGLEREKFRSGLKTRGIGKRKRDEGENVPIVGEEQGMRSITETDGRAVKKKRTKGPKGPNPLSVKKPKKMRVSDEKEELRRETGLDETTGQSDTEEQNPRARVSTVDIVDGSLSETQDREAKRKRKRKHKSKKLEGLIALINNGNEDIE